MRYRKVERSDPGGTISFDMPVDRPEAASAKVRALRERAQRYRELAETFYDRDIVGEVEALANELEDEAAGLEMASFRFFQAA